MNQLSLRKNQLKFKIAGKLPFILEEYLEYSPIQRRKTGGCQHVTGWTWETLGYQLVMPKNLPGHWTGAGSPSLPTGKKILKTANHPRVPRVSRRRVSTHVTNMGQSGDATSPIEQLITSLQTPFPFPFQCLLHHHTFTYIFSPHFDPVEKFQSVAGNNNVEFSCLFLDPTEVLNLHLLEIGGHDVTLLLLSSTELM